MGWSPAIRALILLYSAARDLAPYEKCSSRSLKSTIQILIIMIKQYNESVLFILSLLDTIILVRLQIEHYFTISRRLQFQQGRGGCSVSFEFCCSFMPQVNQGTWAFEIQYN